MQIKVTDRWHETFPGAHVGVLLAGNVDNTKRVTPLDDRKRELEAQLRETYAGLSRAELLELPVLKAYRAFYKRFDQTYHVQLQLESVAHKGKPLPNVSPLVDANFVAELQTLVLTAGHDADLLREPLIVDTVLMEQIELCFGQAQRFELFTGHKSKRNIQLYERLGYKVFKSKEINSDLSFVFLEKHK